MIVLRPVRVDACALVAQELRQARYFLLGLKEQHQQILVRGLAIGNGASLLLQFLLRAAVSSGALA
jgi:hypothetical protein